MAMVKYSDSSSKVMLKLSRQERLKLEKIQEQQMQRKQMENVSLLLQDLAAREETTVKMILDCLYDVGAANLINKKIPYRPLNKMLKAIASMSKPAFRLYAFHWFKKNCPQLIADWLESKVDF